ncbi:hypothetical protein N8371_07390, partial [Vicingaceae bacterium]|nr:hypothetical protein [Vicingaceae bacterium]
MELNTREIQLNNRTYILLRKAFLVLFFVANNFVTFSQSNFVYFNYSQNTYCTSSINPTPIIFTPGGVFSSTTGISINPSTGFIDLGASSPGTYIVTYTLSGISFSNKVTLSAATGAGFSFASTIFCT